MSESKLEFIKLDPSRWEEYRELRLDALKTEPQAFGASYEEEVQKSSEFWIKDLERSQRPTAFRTVLFAQLNGKLVGMGIIFFGINKKFRHIARFSGIYVKKEFRGQGIASKLYEERIKTAFERENLRKIKLTVNVEQKAAIALYKKFGFEIVGNLKDEFNIDGKFYDGYLMEKFREQKTA